MKVYLNKNCSGYHWFETEVSGCEDFISMNYAQPAPESMPILKGLMLHSQYEMCLSCENGTYILSINNIPEHKRTDEIGRPISLQIVFLSKNVEQLWKILFYRMQYDKMFSELLSKCFVSVMAAEGQFVRCDLRLLHELLNSCYAKGFSDQALKISSRKNEKLLYVNKGSRLVMNNIGFSEDEIKKAEYNGAERIEWLVDEDNTENGFSEQIETVPHNNLEHQVEIPKNSSFVSNKEEEDVLSEDDLKQKVNDVPENNQENGRLDVNNDSSNKQMELLTLRLQEYERNHKILKADLASSESALNRISSEMRIELMRYKLISIVLGILFILLLILYIIK